LENIALNKADNSTAAAIFAVNYRTNFGESGYRPGGTYGKMARGRFLPS